MDPTERRWLLEHPSRQTKYLSSLAAWACESADDGEVLRHLRDKTFTLRERSTRSAFPTRSSTATWATVPHAGHRWAWPTAENGD